MKKRTNCLNMLSKCPKEIAPPSWKRSLSFYEKKMKSSRLTTQYDNDPTLHPNGHVKSRRWSWLKACFCCPCLLFVPISLSFWKSLEGTWPKFNITNLLKDGPMVQEIGSLRDLPNEWPVAHRNHMNPSPKKSAGFVKVVFVATQWTRSLSVIWIILCR